MKLPQDKKERAKMLVLIGFGVLAVIFGIVQGVFVPLMKSKQEKSLQLRELREEVRLAKKEISAAERDFQGTERVIEKIRQMSDDYMLHPVLGNYLLGASEAIEDAAKDIEIDIPSVREVGIADRPKSPGKKTENALKAYAVRVTMACGYDDLTRFMNRIEDTNPLLAARNLTISAQPTVNPEKHNVAFEVVWPIWDDEETPARLATPAADSQQETETPETDES